MRPGGRDMGQRGALEMGRRLGTEVQRPKRKNHRKESRLHYLRRCPQPSLFCVGLILRAARGYAIQKPGRSSRVGFGAEERPPERLGVAKGTEPASWSH